MPFFKTCAVKVLSTTKASMSKEAHNVTKLQTLNRSVIFPIYYTNIRHHNIACTRKAVTDEDSHGTNPQSCSVRPLGNDKV